MWLIFLCPYIYQSHHACLCSQPPLHKATKSFWSTPLTSHPVIGQARWRPLYRRKHSSTECRWSRNCKWHLEAPLPHHPSGTLRVCWCYGLLFPRMKLCEFQSFLSAFSCGGFARPSSNPAAGQPLLQHTWPTACVFKLHLFTPVSASYCTWWDWGTAGAMWPTKMWSIPYPKTRSPKIFQNPKLSEGWCNTWRNSLFWNFVSYTNLPRYIKLFFGCVFKILKSIVELCV